MLVCTKMTLCYVCVHVYLHVQVCVCVSVSVCVCEKERKCECMFVCVHVHVHVYIVHAYLPGEKVHLITTRVLFTCPLHEELISAFHSLHYASMRVEHSNASSK